MTFNSLFADPRGRTSRGQYLCGLIPLLLVTAFYYVKVKGLNGEWCLTVLLIPGFMLHARRLHDMGLTAWLMLVPTALMAAAIWPAFDAQRATLGFPVGLVALAVYAFTIVWCVAGRGQVEANRFGEAVAG